MLTLSQRDRDRLAVLKQVEQGLVAARRGAELLGITSRHFRRLRRRWERAGDGVVIHGLRGRRSNRAKASQMRGRASPVWYRNQHGIKQPFLLASARIQRGEGVGEPEELRPSFLFGLDQGPQGVGRPSGLEEHCGVNPIQCGGVGGRETSVVSEQRAVSAANLRAGFGDQVREERLLLTSCQVASEPIGINLPYEGSERLGLVIEGGPRARL